jgi:hypothetical protein
MCRQQQRSERCDTQALLVQHFYTADLQAVVVKCPFPSSSTRPLGSLLPADNGRIIWLLLRNQRYDSNPSDSLLGTPGLTIVMVL